MLNPILCCTVVLSAPVLVPAVAGQSDTNDGPAGMPDAETSDDVWCLR